MNSKRVYYLMIGLILLLCAGLLAGAYGTTTLLASQAASLTKLKAKSSALTKEQQGLVIAKAQVAQYSELNAIVSSIVPQDKVQAEAVREIVSIADQNGVSLGSITFPASTLGVSTAPTGGTTATPGAASTKPFSSSGSKTNGLSQLQPVKNIPGVYDLQITVQGDPNKSVPYSQFINFLGKLEHNRRTAQVSIITLVPDPKNAKNLTFSLTLDEYIKP